MFTLETDTNSEAAALFLLADRGHDQVHCSLAPPGGVCNVIYKKQRMQKNYRVSQKKGICQMMPASIVGPAWGYRVH